MAIIGRARGDAGLVRGAATLPGLHLLAMTACAAGTGHVSLRHSHISPEKGIDCSKEVEDLRKPKQQADAAACEKKGKFDEQVLSRLKAGEQEAAVKATSQAFVKCGGLSETCASKVAPGVVRKLRLAGLPITDECESKLKTTRKDEKLMKSARKCETDEDVGQKVMLALSQRDVDGSIEIAEDGYKKCMKLSKVCSFQVAPVLVNRILTMSVMRTSGVMPVLTVTSAQVLEGSGQTSTSLFGDLVEEPQHLP